MAEFKIDGRMTVRQLKENFKNEFEGTLRVYNGREKADDNATLAAIRKKDRRSQDRDEDYRRNKRRFKKISNYGTKVGGVLWIVLLI